MFRPDDSPKVAQGPNESDADGLAPKRLWRSLLGELLHQLRERLHEGLKGARLWLK